MERQAQLAICKKCAHKKFDASLGLLCGLTGKVADFEDSCAYFSEDENALLKNPSSEIETASSYQITEDDIQSLRSHQDFFYGIVGGLLAAGLGAILWAAITVATEYQIGFMAIGVGLLVGFAVRFFGAGIDAKFGYLGAVLSLVGCLLGNLFSQIGFIAEAQGLGYFETLTLLDLPLIGQIMIESFSPMDLIFYGIAVFEGYKFSFRKITAEEILMVHEGKSIGHPQFYKLRTPLVVVAVVIIGIFLFQLKQGKNGHREYYYESGGLMSEGDVDGGKEEGEWTYYYENGQIQSVGYFRNGQPDSAWIWYDEQGNLMTSGFYAHGLEEGVWINYYPNGVTSDSSVYAGGRKDGIWESWYENGQLAEAGFFKRNQPDSVWQHYYENGQLMRTGEYYNGDPLGEWQYFYADGQPEKVLEYIDAENYLINQAWDQKGKQLVVNGSGEYRSYYESSILLEKGKVENGRNAGEWIGYYESGNKKEVRKYENGEARLMQFWNESGEELISDGEGTYQDYYPGDQGVLSKGDVVNGHREGLWKVYYPGSGAVFQDLSYVGGKLNGTQTYYFEDGQINTSGTMKEGKREGMWEWYYPNGLLNSSVNFVNDKKEGKQIMYSETGEKAREEVYKDGELVEEVLF